MFVWMDQTFSYMVSYEIDKQKQFENRRAI